LYNFKKWAENITASYPLLEWYAIMYLKYFILY